jgi:adenosylcobyric acid synthase
MNAQRDTLPARSLAVLGTGSEVGKSVITTAFCRVLSNKGVRVAPFKAQNMSNNSGVTPEGLEMGRAQIVQAEAARIVPHVDMNPVLLKPAGAAGSQTVLLGKAIGNRGQKRNPVSTEDLFNEAAGACDRLRCGCDMIVIEGAGSCAEVNLLAKDYINFRMAAHAGAPVILVADIDRGGVFAQIVGTLACLPPDHRKRIEGFIINRFRGTPALLEDGLRWIEKKTGKPVLGVLPWFDHIHIEPEDAVTIERPEKVNPQNSDTSAIAIVRLPHISNFNDFEPLRRIEGLETYYLEKVQPLSPFRAVILPGSKNTRGDLDWLRKKGWADELSAYRRNGGHLLGICGGYQMMGTAVNDPDGLEGPPGASQGLGFLPLVTTLKSPKTTTLTQFAWGSTGALGYEIHMGRSERKGETSLFEIKTRNGAVEADTDGCVSEDGRVLGTYLHGIFDNPGITRRWLDHLGLTDIVVPRKAGIAYRDEQYDLLAAHFAKHVRVDDMMRLVK